MKAIWISEYDNGTDSIYECPCCPECETPIFGIDEEEKAECSFCGKEVELDNEQKEWIKSHIGNKVEEHECFECGGTMEILYSKNPVNDKWEVLTGECKDCGIRFIV